MSLIEDVYKEHYSQIRKRLMGKINKSVMTEPVEPSPPDKTDKPYWQILQERKKAADLVAKRLLDEAIIKHASVGSKTPAQLLIKRVAMKHGVTYEDIVGPTKPTKLVKARFEAIKLVHETYPCKSLPEIGRLFKRDHTSILHVLRKMGCWKPSAKRQMIQRAECLFGDNMISQPYNLDAEADSTA